MKTRTKGETKRGRGKPRRTSAGKKTDSETTTSLSASAEASSVLDPSDSGRPVVEGDGPLGATRSPLTPADEKLAVDIQLAPGAVHLRASLTGNTDAFWAAAGAAPPSEAGLAAVLRRFGLTEARAHYDETQI